MDDDITITVPDSSYDTFNISSGDITIDTSSLTSSIIGPYPSYNIGIGAAGSNGPYITTTNNTWIGSGSFNAASTPSTLQVTGDAEFAGDVKIKGVSIAKVLEDIQKRLAILVPDPAKLEHFAALKKAYDHYKTLEALCELPKKENKE